MGYLCKNCGTQYEGNYCSQCGQKASIGKLTLRSVLDNWAYGLINCDTGIIFTYIELFTRPGHMLSDYIRGKRVIYFQPFPMLFITAGLYGLLSQILLPPPAKATVDLPSLVTFQERLFHLLSTWIHSSMAFTAIATLPFFAWAARYTFPPFHPLIPNRRQLLATWVCHRLLPACRPYPYQLSDYLFISTYTYRYKYMYREKNDYNFTEYIFIFAYIACQRLVVGIFLTIPVMLLTHTSELTGKWNYLIYFVYFALLLWDFKQLYRLNIGKALKKTLLLLCNWVLLLLSLGILLVAFLVAFCYVGAEIGFIPQEAAEEVEKAFLN